MTEQVVDASVPIKWVVKGEPFRNKARQLLHDARLKGIILIAPPLLEYKIESNLQHRLRYGRATNAAVDASLAAFHAVRMPVEEAELASLLDGTSRMSREAHVWNL